MEAVVCKPMVRIRQIEPQNEEVYEAMKFTKKPITEATSFNPKCYFCSKIVYFLKDCGIRSKIWKEIIGEKKKKEEKPRSLPLNRVDSNGHQLPYYTSFNISSREKPHNGRNGSRTLAITMDTGASHSIIRSDLVEEVHYGEFDYVKQQVRKFRLIFVLRLSLM